MPNANLSFQHCNLMPLFIGAWRPPSTKVSRGQTVSQQRCCIHISCVWKNCQIDWGTKFKMSIKARLPPPLLMANGLFKRAFYATTQIIPAWVLLTIKSFWTDTPNRQPFHLPSSVSHNWKLSLIDWFMYRWCRLSSEIRKLRKSI